MAYHKQFNQPKSTCVQTEQSLYDICKKLGIVFNRAFNAGVCATIEDRIEDENNPRVTPEIVEQYRAYKNKALDDLKTQVSARNIIREEDVILATIQARAEDQQAKQEERIRVFDTIEEKYRDILRKQMTSWYIEVKPLLDEEGNVIWEHDTAVA